jgi:hypothetical protein
MTEMKNSLKEMKNRRLFGLLVGLTAVLSLPAADARRPMTLVVMVDGLRADAVETGRMPNLIRLKEGLWQKDYPAAWSLTAQTAPKTLPSSAPNHVSIATGFTPAEHGVTSNDALSGGTSSSKKTWLKRICDAQEGASALFVYSWAPDANIAPNEGLEQIGGTDADNIDRLAARLSASDAPDATLYFIDCLDAAGHQSGYYTFSTTYLDTLTTVDGYLGRCLKAIADRPTFAEEDWLIAVTSDHGGYSVYHGQIIDGGAAQTVPLVIAGRHVTAGRIPGISYNYDVAATVLAHFGVPASDLTATRRDGVTQTPRRLSDGLVAYLPFNTSATDNAVASSPITPETVGSPSLVANGMRGASLNITQGNVVKLAGSESLSFEDSGRGFTAVLWAKFNQPSQGDPVLIGNKSWSGLHKGLILTAKKTAAGWTSPANTAAGVGLNIGSGSSRLDLYPMPTEGGSLWTFYAVTSSEDGVFTLYQGRSDGTLYWVSGRETTVTLASNMPFYIGQDGTGAYGRHFAGQVDDVALWTRGLTHDDIRRIFTCGRAGMELGDVLTVDANDAPEMTVAGDKGDYTLTFGGRRTRSHALFVASGAVDGGQDKYAWDSFVKVADISATTLSYVYTVPEELKAANAFFRFFLVQTENLPYVKEVTYAHSNGKAWIDTGIAPRRELVADFLFRMTANNTEWGTGKTDTQTAIYENIFGAFGGSDKRGNYGLCRYRKSGNVNHLRFDREYCGYDKAPQSVLNYQFVGSCENDIDYHVIYSTTNLVVNGTAYGSGVQLSNFIEGGYGIALYRNLKNGAVYDDTMIGRFERFALLTPTCTVRDYVPAVDAQGAVGLFDTVTGRFQTSAGDPLTAGEDRVAGRFGWVRAVSATAYSASQSLPVTATYTGKAADPLDLSDPANWACTNGYGECLQAAVPTSLTEVTVAGETAFSVPAGAAPLACAFLRFDEATPRDNMDLRGLDYSKVSPDSRIDLKGRSLFLADETSAPLSLFSVTDSSTGQPGVVRVAAADGAALVNRTVTLSGNLTLVKEGRGSFSPLKSQQSYTGGTRVQGGLLRLGPAVAGPVGSGPVFCAEGSTLDLAGADASALDVVLAGATLTSSAAAKAQLPSRLRLDADAVLAFAAISSQHDMTIPKGAVWNLGGRTLSVVMDGTDPDLELKQATVTNGTFAVTVRTYAGLTKGYVQIDRLNGRDALSLDLGNSYLRLSDLSAGDSSVTDFTADTPDAVRNVYSYLNYRLMIYGTFKPKTPRGFKMKLMNGSQLNLSAVTGVFNCTFANAADSTPSDLVFDEGTIQVNLAGRTDLKELASSEASSVVVWKTEPPDETTFVLDPSSFAKGYRLLRQSGGLKLYVNPGFKLYIK